MREIPSQRSLRVLDGAAAERSNAVRLAPSEQLSKFIRAAADSGLSPELAVRLAVERELAIADGRIFGLSAEAVRHLLAEAARAARPRRVLGAREASYVRRLSIGRSLSTPDVGGGLRVPLPERLLARASGAVRLSSLDEAIVPEMVAWELAATVEGRTMGEWALKSLARARRAA